MKTVHIREAKTHRSRLVEEAAKGEPFIIAKAEKPVVQVTKLAALTGSKRRVGFMKGAFTVPDDFDTMIQDEIIALFEGQDCCA